MDRFEVTPGEVWEWSGGVRSYVGVAATDVTYYKESAVSRVVRAIPSPYLIEAQEGETHVSVSVRVDGVVGDALYID